MLNNPFTPLFGGKPSFFFGRETVLKRFNEALFDAGSEYRALFITGSRGYGKTALLEQLSIKAKEAGWQTIDVGPDNPIGGIMRHLVPFDEKTSTVDPRISATIFGTGGSVGGVSSAKVTRYGAADLEYVLVKMLERKSCKLFLTLDEVQKASLDDVSAICNAFQMAARKGFDVALAVAGLPYSYGKVVHHDGCTFMRRAVHEELGPFTPGVVEQAFRSAFAGIRGLQVDNGAITELVNRSKGHPYFMQLEGYYLVQSVNDHSMKGKQHVTEDMVKRSVPMALEAYERRALDPLLEETPRVEREYLAAMAEVMDDDRVARSADVAKRMNRTMSAASTARQYLLDNGIVYAPRRGQLIFLIPYLADYLLRKEPAADDSPSVAELWRM